MNTYLDLVKEFPLVPIRDDDHLQSASKMIDWLLRMNLDDEQELYFDLLTYIVEYYESKQGLIPDVSNGDMLHELMHTNRMSYTSFAQLLNISRGELSDILNDERQLTKPQINLLSKRFHISPDAFV